VFDDLAHAADLGGARDGVVVDDAEAEVGMEERVHHDAVAELEDLEGEDRTGEEDQREREERELKRVVVGLLLRRRRASERVETPATAQQ